jgi:hypothetical protein
MKKPLLTVNNLFSAIKCSEIIHQNRSIILRPQEDATRMVGLWRGFSLSLSLCLLLWHPSAPSGQYQPAYGACRTEWLGERRGIAREGTIITWGRHGGRCMVLLSLASVKVRIIFISLVHYGQIPCVQNTRNRDNAAGRAATYSALALVLSASSCQSVPEEIRRLYLCAQLKRFFFITSNVHHWSENIYCWNIQTKENLREVQGKIHPCLRNLACPNLLKSCGPQVSAWQNTTSQEHSAHRWEAWRH